MWTSASTLKVLLLKLGFLSKWVVSMRCAEMNKKDSWWSSLSCSSMAGGAPSSYTWFSSRFKLKVVASSDLMADSWGLTYLELTWWSRLSAFTISTSLSTSGTGIFPTVSLLSSRLASYLLFCGRITEFQVQWCIDRSDILRLSLCSGLWPFQYRGLRTSSLRSE